VQGRYVKMKTSRFVFLCWSSLPERRKWTVEKSSKAGATIFVFQPSARARYGPDKNRRPISSSLKTRYSGTKKKVLKAGQGKTRSPVFLTAVPS